MACKQTVISIFVGTRIACVWAALCLCANTALASEEAARYAVTREHPRLLGSRQRLQMLARQRPEAYRRVVRVAREQKADDHAKMISMALVCAIEQDAQLGSRAVQMATKYVNYSSEPISFLEIEKYMAKTETLSLILVLFARIAFGAGEVPQEISSFFEPTPEFADDFGNYKSPLILNDGTAVKTASDWSQRRREIIATWEAFIGSWPPLIEKPNIEYLSKERREKLTQHRVSVEIAPNQQAVDGYLLVPDGSGPFPAVLVVYYDAETGAGLGKEYRDFALQLARRGFVTLSIGTPDFCSLQAPYKPLCETQFQPLSALAYVAANCHRALAGLKQVDPDRIGVMGHSYGGKWAMFASCLYDKFACAAWSDPGIVFDESRSNVNYWEPWYLGYESDKQRQRGIPSKTKPRTGAYKDLVRTGHDLHELHALMAPKPFFVSGGSEDTPERWKALNHTVAVNKLLGYENRVAMANRKDHAPTAESNEQIYVFFEFFLRNAN